MSSLTSEDIMARIMAKAIDDVPTSANPLKRFHVSQTADQLPDIRLKQAMYRTELEKQIEEQRERERRRRELEAEDEERLEMKLQAEREKLRRERMDETESRRLKVTSRSIQQKGSRFNTTTTEEQTERQQEEARRRQAVIAKRLEEIKEAAEREKEEEAEKRKRFYLEHLYNPQRSSYLPTYYRSRPWNSRDYVHAALDLSLEEVYKSAPLHLVADVYRKLDFEKAKIREIIRARLKQGEIEAERGNYEWEG